MADDSKNENALPPKLNLRKKVNAPLSPKPLVPPESAKDKTAQTPAAPTSLPPTATPKTPATPAPPSADSPKPATPAAPTTDALKSAAPKTPSEAPTQGSTMRMKLPADPPAAKAATPADKTPPPAAGETTAAPAPKPTAAPEADAEKGETPAARPQIRPTMAPKTIKLKKPVPLGIKRDTPDPAAPAGSKRATSKISLPTDPDAGDDEAASKPKPIQVPKRQSTEAEPASDSADAAAPQAATPAPAQPPPDPKRQTSRISLDSAFGSENDSGSGPKTIKLKRPGSSTVKVQGMAGGDDASAKTADADQPKQTDSQDDEAPDTQKKTIKVKRPTAKPSLRTASKKTSVTVNKSGGGGSTGSATMFAPPAAKAAPVDGAHWFFILTGCAATIITGVLIYVQCAQALGPDYSLTPLSYGAPEAELPWPGRLER